MSHKLINKEKKYYWKLSNLFIDGIACLVVLFSVIIDLISVIIKSDTVTCAISIIAAIFIGASLFMDYKKVFKNVSNKELLSDIMGAWTTMGIFVFIVEKGFLSLLSYSNDWITIITAIVLLVIFLFGGVWSTIVIVKKPEWKYRVDV